MISHQPLRVPPPQHQAEGWKRQKTRPQALPPGGYSPFSVYLPQPHSHQQSLGHQKLQMTCQVECHYDSINDKAGTGSKKDYVKLGHRLQDTPIFPRNTAQGFAPNGRALRRGQRRLQSLQCTEAELEQKGLDQTIKTERHREKVNP